MPHAIVRFATIPGLRLALGPPPPVEPPGARSVGGDPCFRAACTLYDARPEDTPPGIPSSSAKKRALGTVVEYSPLPTVGKTAAAACLARTRRRNGLECGEPVVVMVRGRGGECSGSFYFTLV